MGWWRTATGDGGAKRRRTAPAGQPQFHCAPCNENFQTYAGLGVHRASARHMEGVAAAEAAGGAPSARGHRQDSLDGEGGCDGAAEASEEPASAAVGGARAAACMQPRQPPLQRPPLPAPPPRPQADAAIVAPPQPPQAAQAAQAPQVAAAGESGSGLPPRIRLRQGPLRPLKSGNSGQRAPQTPDVPLSGSAARLAARLTFSQKLLAPVLASMSRSAGNAVLKVLCHERFIVSEIGWGDMDAFCTDLNADRVTPRRPSQAMPPCLAETSACILMITRPCLTEA